LRWSDVDLKAGTLLIGRSVGEGPGAEIVEKDTKTHAARRIALDPDSVDVLRTHRDRMTERAVEFGVKMLNDSYVFSRSPGGRRPWVPNEVTEAFIQLRNQMGITGIRLHDLRHFVATQLLAAGVPVRPVSGRLGHANAATTLGVYAHSLKESDREAAETLGALLRK